MRRVREIIFAVLIGEKFFDVRGRAGLAEFWTIVLVFGLLPAGLAELIPGANVIKTASSFFLIFLSPWIISSVIVRRLHDLNLSGWNLLLVYPLLILPFIQGKNLPNRFDEKE